MRLRAISVFVLLFTSAVAALATDYDLVVSEGASSVKQAQSLQVFDPTGKLKKGDHIISVLYDSSASDGTACSIALGSDSPAKADLAAAGEATGFDGALQLASGSPSRHTYHGALIALPPHPAASDDKAMARKAMVEKATSLPWLWIGGGIGLLGLVGFMIRRGGSSDPSPIFNYSGGGKGLKEALPELKDRLDKIEQAQHRLVKDPPVLRTFKNQVAQFDQRLKQLEGASQSIERALTGISNSLASLDSRFTQSVSDDKTPETLRTLTQSLSQLSADNYRRFDESREQVKNVLAVQDKLMPLPSRVEALDGELKELSKRAQSLENKMGSATDQQAGAFSGLQQQIAEVSGRLSELDKIAQVEKSVQELNSIRDDLNVLSTKLAEFGASAEASASKIELLPKLLGMLNEEIDEKLAVLKRDLSHSIESLPEQMSTPVAPQHVPTPEPVAVEIEAIAEEPEPVAEETPVEVEELPAVTEEEPQPGLLKNDIPESGGAPWSDEGAEGGTYGGGAKRPKAACRSRETPSLDSPQPEELIEEVAEQPAAETQETPEEVSPPEQNDQIEELVAHIEAEPEAPMLDIPADDPLIIHEDEDAEAPTHIGGGKWASEAGSGHRHWSTEFSRPIAFMQSANHIRPLTPMDTPSISSPIGGMVYANGRVVYGHGDAIRAFWPGKEERSVPLARRLPSDAWRMLMFDSQLFCAEEGSVEIINTNSWSLQGRFDGDYLNQIHTDRHWVGVRSQDGQLAVELRSDAGTLFGEPNVLEVDAGEPYHLASSGNDVYVVSGSGNLLKVGPEGSGALANLGEGRLLQLSVHSNNLLAVSQQEGQVHLRMLGMDGSVIREGFLEISNPFENFVIMGSKLYAMDQDTMEVHTVNLKTLKSTGARVVHGGNRVRKLGGIQHGSNHLLMIASDDSTSHKGQVILVNLKSGDELPLCTLNHRHVDLIAADHHVVLATSCSYQNIIQVFEPFTARDSLRDAA